MKIIWTDFAIKNLKDIFKYYSEEASKKVAHKIKNHLLDTTKQLIHNPGSGQQELSPLKLKQHNLFIKWKLQNHLSI